MPVVGQARSTQRYQGGRREKDAVSCAELRRLSAEHPRSGYRMATALSRRAALGANAKLEVERRMEARDVIRILETVVVERGGPPEFIRSDNGPEFIALAVRTGSNGVSSALSTSTLERHGKLPIARASTAGSGMSS